MDLPAHLARKCPKCSSSKYQFRARKTLDLPLEKGGGQVVETTYRCTDCNKAWKEQVPAVEKKAG